MALAAELEKLNNFLEKEQVEEFMKGIDNLKTMEYIE